eukprot:6461172-Amphidinium_carterae.1
MEVTSLSTVVGSALYVAGHIWLDSVASSSRLVSRTATFATKRVWKKLDELMKGYPLMLEGGEVKPSRGSDKCTFLAILFQSFPISWQRQKVSWAPEAASWRQ